jgi:hypothetical protein
MKGGGEEAPEEKEETIIASATPVPVGFRGSAAAPGP